MPRGVSPWKFTSGHVEAGETPAIAICRETKEESGIIIKPEDVKFVQVMYRRSCEPTGDGFDKNAPERVDFFFSTTKWYGEPHITEPHKCDDLRWFSFDALPDNLLCVVRGFLLTRTGSLQYIEGGY